MFHPNDQPLERGWVGRIDGDRVIHLAAQTLQSFFLGGGGAREHAEYPLADVTLLVPVLHPPAVRLFDAQDSFEFANPSAVQGPEATVVVPAGAETLTLLPRLAAVIGADSEIGGFSLFLDWRAPTRTAPKDRDFGFALGPVVVTPDDTCGSSAEVEVEVDGTTRLSAPIGGFGWDAALELAREGTVLRPGEIVAAPATVAAERIGPGSEVEAGAPVFGVLRATVAG
jgi:hypothetical protein